MKQNENKICESFIIFYPIPIELVLSYGPGRNGAVGYGPGNYGPRNYGPRNYGPVSYGSSNHGRGINEQG